MTNVTHGPATRTWRARVVRSVEHPDTAEFATGIAAFDASTGCLVAASRSLRAAIDVAALRDEVAVPPDEALPLRLHDVALTTLGGDHVVSDVIVSRLDPRDDDPGLELLHIENAAIAAVRTERVTPLPVEIAIAIDADFGVRIMSYGPGELGWRREMPEFEFDVLCHPFDRLATTQAIASVVVGGTDASAFAFRTFGLTGEWVYWAGRARRVVRDGNSEALISLHPAQHSTCHRADLDLRERELLARIAAGWSTERIADRLWMSASTVRNHVAALAHKLELEGRRAIELDYPPI